MPEASIGIGDTNLGMKWNFHSEAESSVVPAMSVTFYIELPTGDTKEQLGSGRSDYWINFIAQRHLTTKNRLTLNLGTVFTGDTSTGELGIHTTHGRVYTGGLSFLRDVNARWTVGAEVYGGFSNTLGQTRSQFQILVGGNYQIRNGLTFDFGVLGGKFIASPRIGAQFGFSVDFPAVLRRKNTVREQNSSH
ncbi:MAG: transporter [Terriglobia bacterium]